MLIDPREEQGSEIAWTSALNPDSPGKHDDSYKDRKPEGKKNDDSYKDRGPRPHDPCNCRHFLSLDFTIPVTVVTF